MGKLWKVSFRHQKGKVSAKSRKSVRSVIPVCSTDYLIEQSIMALAFLGFIL